MIHDEGISIPGIKKLLRYAPCWEITDCPREVCEPCTAQIDVAVPRTLRVAGDKDAEKRAKDKEVAARQKDVQEKSDKKTSSSLYRSSTVKVVSCLVNLQILRMYPPG